MSSITNSVTIAPSFTRALRILLTILPALFVVIILIGLARGETPIANLVKHWSSEETMWSVIAVGFLAFCAAGIAAIGRYAALVVGTQVISGRTEKGRRVRISTDSVSAVEYRRNPRVPGLYVTSSQSDERLLAVLWGVDLAKVSEELASTIGPTHQLTRWFREHAT